VILTIVQASFSTFLNLSVRDDILGHVDTADMIQNPVKNAKRASSGAETSYYVEVRTSDMKISNADTRSSN
jgi:hypothetical protein